MASLAIGQNRQLAGLDADISAGNSKDIEPVICGHSKSAATCVDLGRYADLAPCPGCGLSWHAGTTNRKVMWTASGQPSLQLTAT